VIWVSLGLDSREITYGKLNLILVGFETKLLKTEKKIERKKKRDKPRPHT